MNTYISTSCDAEMSTTYFRCIDHLAIDDVLNLNSTFDGYTFAAVILTFDIMMIPRYSVHKRVCLMFVLLFFFFF